MIVIRAGDVWISFWYRNFLDIADYGKQILSGFVDDVSYDKGRKSNLDGEALPG